MTQSFTLQVLHDDLLRAGTRNRDVCCCLRRFAKAAGLPLSQIAADPALIARLMQTARPAVCGMDPKRWQNVCYGVRRALRLVGLLPERAATPQALPPVWEAIAVRPRHAAERSCLRRFARYCLLAGVEPADVTDNVLLGYEAALAAQQLSISPARTAKDVRLFWNRLADSDPTLVRFSDLRLVRHYALAWDELPPSLHDDVVAYLGARGASSALAFDRVSEPLSQASLDKYGTMLRRLASAAVHAGVPISDLTTLAALVQPTVVKTALTWIHERSKPSRTPFDLAVLAHGIAREWAHASVADLDALNAMTKALRPRRRPGMTIKNSGRLEQFVSPTLVSRFASLPDKVFAALNDAAPSIRSAGRAQAAIMVLILTYAPMRLKNLRLLDWQRHIRPSLSGCDAWQIVLRKDEVKNDIDLFYALGNDQLALIERYMKVYQPLLGQAPSTLLFPGRAGGSITDSGARGAIVRLLKRELGVDMNPHLFRHLAGKLYLDAHPGDYETVRQFLGHKSLLTTTSFYTGRDQHAATSLYGEVLGNLTTKAAGRR